MDIFDFMLLRFIIIVLTIFTIAAPANAQQWAPVGDAGLRRDVELLKAYDIIDGPVNTWPISWRQITASINVSVDQIFPTHVIRAIDRVKRKIPNKGFRGSAAARYTNEPSLVRGFGDTAQSDADLTLSAGFTDEKIEANVSVNYRDHVSNNNVNFDGSYIATHIGNWSLYAGAINRWWGPGQENTLLLSANARPMVSAGVRRNDPRAFKSKWLSWTGPWTWDMFVANMGNDRHIPDALMAGMRLGFEPINNFEVGLSRTMQLCGLNRPCNFNTWTRALISVGDLDNGAGAQEPGNQLASIDLSYSMNISNKSIKVYAEGTAEDQHVVLPFQFSRLIGSSFVTPIGENGDNLTFNVELSDSGNVKAWLFGQRRAGIIYNHSIYRTGHRYDGRTLGHSFDNDSKLASVSVIYTRGNGDKIKISLSSASINWDDTARNIVSAQRQKYQNVELSALKNTQIGQVEAKMSVQTKAITLTQGVLPRFLFGMAWRFDL